MIAWCGSSHDGLSWLRSRFENADEVQVRGEVNCAAIDELCSHHPRRLTLAIDARVDYPLREIQHLTHAWPEIPWGVAVSSWHDGARRTGIGSTSHLTLPWYRWWDGWYQWLTTSDANLLGPWPRISSALTQNCCNRPPVSLHGLILCNCHRTSIGWCQSLPREIAAKDDETSSKLQVPMQLTTRQLPDWLAAPTFIPRWILWDDSCLDSFQIVKHVDGPCNLFATLKKHFPNSMLILATDLPCWAGWQQWMNAGADELIAKPSPGMPLFAAIRERLKENVPSTTVVQEECMPSE
jgi:hypothetical protein